MNDTRDASNKWKRWSQWALWFTAISALWGGGQLVGDALHYPIKMLDGTPFDTFLVPGLILTFAVGGSSLLAAMAHIRHWESADELTFVAGAILVGWIVVEFVMIPEGWIPQLIWGIPSIFMLRGGYLTWRDEAKTQPIS